MKNIFDYNSRELLYCLQRVMLREKGYMYSANLIKLFKVVDTEDNNVPGGFALFHTPDGDWVIFLRDLEQYCVEEEFHAD